MNIQILDSWLRDHLNTKAKPKDIADLLSLSSVSVERLEKKGEDFLYDIEVTTNRPDLMSIVGLAREAAAVLKQNNISAEFIPIKIPSPEKIEASEKIGVHDNPKLVNRICAVVMEVTVKESPKYIQDRLEATGIRSLNNLIDITNYVMRTIGHPSHVFDFDKIPSRIINIRESKKDERITTLDGKDYVLAGGDIVADDNQGRIIDLLGVMGLKNSVVDSNTKRIVFFIDNNDPQKIRKTSMQNGIRTDAAVLNEKGVDPELALDALLYGIELYKKLADGKIISEIIDLYPNRKKPDVIKTTSKKINSVIGIDLPIKYSADILHNLGFKVDQAHDTLTVVPPSFRAHDVHIEEDVVEEIARIYGYHNIPDRLPSVTSNEPYVFEKNHFFYEDRMRDALKYWGFNEVYTYPMVSEKLYEGDTSNAVMIQNPLNEDLLYMRATLVPSLLQVITQNKDYDKIRIFEIGNVYKKNGDNLPVETQKIACVLKSKDISFYKVKGIIETLLADIGIAEIEFRNDEGESEVGIYIKNKKIGEVEILDHNLINFEMEIESILEKATLKKIYKPVSKFPPIIEDLAIIINSDTPTGEIIKTISEQSSLIHEVSLLDKFESTRTFHIVYQSNERNLTTDETDKIREKIVKELKDKFGARLKE
jgi:phenylalanyl-tRNA synthetase beta chain